MKRIHLLLPLLILMQFYGVLVHSQGIAFDRMDLQTALNKSKETHKLIFIDCYATWCGPCKKLSNEIFTQNSVGSLFNDNFICLTLDMEGKGKDVREKFHVNAFPTLLFLDQEGNEVQRSVGFLSADELTDLGVRALDPEKNDRTLSQRFQKGDVDYNVVENQLRGLNENISVDGLLDKYFKTIEPSQWYENDAWSLIKEYAPISSNYFRFLLVNEEMFCSKYGKQTVERVIEKKFETFYDSDFQTMGMDKQKAGEYLKSFQHPMAIKAILKSYKKDLVDYLVESPRNVEYWRKLFQTIDKLINNFGPSEKENFRTTAVRLCIQDKYNKRVLKTIAKTNDKWAPMMVQNLKICHLKSLLEKNKLSKKRIIEINTSVNEIADSILVQIVYADQLASLLLKHPQRDRFLAGARKISFSLLTYKALNYMETYANICAQMRDFDEAIKYTRIILKMARKRYPDRTTSIEGMLGKFQQHQTPY